MVRLAVLSYRVSVLFLLCNDGSVLPHGKDVISLIGEYSPSIPMTLLGVKVR